MRRSAIWAIGLFGGLAVLVGGLHHWPLASARIGVQLDQQIASRIGLHARRAARATLTLLPWPTVRVTGFDVVDARGASVFSAPTARFPLSLTRLMVGSFVPVGAMFSSPTASIDLDAASAAAANPPDAGDNSEPPSLWSRVRLAGGVAHVVSASRGIDVLIDNVDGSIDWPAAGAPMRFSLAAAWRGESVAIRGAIADPRAIAERRAAPLSFSIASRPLVFSFDGRWGGDAHVGFAGRLSTQIPSLGALQRLLGAGSATPLAGGPLSLEADARTNDASLILDDARIELAGQSFEGALTLSRDNGRAALAGTLAADTLDLDPLLGAPPAFMDAAGAWSAEPFDFAPPGDLDLDLRVSAARVSWSGHEIDDAAGSLFCRDGALTAKLLQSTAYGGALRGQLTLARRADALDAQTTVSLVDADLGAAFADFGWRGYRGRGGLELSLRAAGRAPADAVASSSGAASLDLQAGAVDGLSVEQAIRRSQRRPLVADRDLVAGQTAFMRAHAHAALANGVATLGEATVAGPAEALTIDGAIDLVRRALRLRMAATQTDASGAPSADAARLTVVFEGPWSAPTVVAVPSNE
jgi:AsmA protein